jgi:hypothetical protein
MKLRKGWAIVDKTEYWTDPRRSPKQYRAFDIYRSRAEARRCISFGEVVVRVEYRFPRKK